MERSAFDENLLWQSRFCALLPCSNFQSSAMFEAAESAEVEGRSTDSTLASSISACKKVKVERSSTYLGFNKSALTSPCVSPSVCAAGTCPPLLSDSCRNYLSFPWLLLVSPAEQEILISSPLVLVTPRGCVIRGTLTPSGHPSRFIITPHNRDRRGDGADHWAEGARLNFSLFF